MVPVAAAFFARAFVDIKESEYDKIVDVDQKGQYFLVQAAARSMIRGGRGGKVVTVASVAYRGEDMPKLAMMTAYNSAKAGVVGMTRGIAKELKQDKRSVENAIFRARRKLRRALPPQE